MNSIQDRRKELIDRAKFYVVVQHPAHNSAGFLCDNFREAVHYFQDERTKIPQGVTFIPVIDSMWLVWNEPARNAYDHMRIKSGSVALYERIGDDWVLMQRTRFNQLLRDLHTTEQATDTEILEATWLFTDSQLSDLLEGTIGMYEEYLGHKAEESDPKESAKWATLSEMFEGLRADATLEDEGHRRGASLMGG